VFFTNNNVTDVVELESTEPTQVRVIISRQNSEEAATVPLKVISADDIFIIPETVTFEAGVDTTSFLVIFPEANEGNIPTLSAVPNIISFLCRYSKSYFTW